MSPRLLEKLVCPRCHGTLVFREASQRLECNACALGYPVVNGIPVMLVDEAKSLR
ncbi:hypothetical protein C3F09_13045 [candidate division GN15 bacterium]|uniref:UPF0434 protein C3F09_13045 n=1 Tax=candidate division GN15 bacterium TaxID=2072418 RepID=A0A855WUN6_9BACT|nr:MAG: hypothetical protein C3F09_13045 [candidate division GN15 bacterium]